MAKNFDKELYVKQDFVEEFLKSHEVAYRQKRISIEESLTNFINAILDDRLAVLNDKCATCTKKAVCLLWDRLVNQANLIIQREHKFEFTACIVRCNNYQKKG